MDTSKLTKPIYRIPQLPTQEELFSLVQQGFKMPSRGFTLSKQGLIIPNQSKYKRILMTGSTGSGKSTTADTLAKQTGYPHMHTDLYRFDSNFSMVPDEVLANSIIGFIEENPTWILDYTRMNNDATLFNWLLSKTDLTLHFDFSLKDSMHGYQKKESDFYNGIPPRGLPNNPKFFGENVKRFLRETNIKYLNELPDFKKKLRLSNVETKTLHSYTEVDKLLAEFEQHGL